MYCPIEKADKSLVVNYEAFFIHIYINVFDKMFHGIKLFSISKREYLFKYCINLISIIIIFRLLALFKNVFQITLDLASEN